jgi:HAD superfamily hydrolase (TIGR01509 family)
MLVYLFDFDGTLVDSMSHYKETIKGILDDHAVDYPEDIIQRLATCGTVGSAEYMIQMGLKMSVDEVLDVMKERFCHAYFRLIQAKPFVIDTLFRLKEQGIRMSILTASPHLTLDACLKRLGIFDLFEKVWSTDDFFLPKTDPEIYRLVASRCEVSPHRILFFDDNPQAGKTAQKAGLKYCAVWDESADETEEKIREFADYYIKDFREIMDL